MARMDDSVTKGSLEGTAAGGNIVVRPVVPDHEMVRCIGRGSYGEVWLARSAVGTWRAVKVVYRTHFKDARPYEREFSGIQKYEPISRANDGLVDVLQIGRNDEVGYFYYVMELADDAGPLVNAPSSGASGLKPSFNPEAYIPKTLGREIQQRGRLPVEECITLGLTLNLALGHLHRRGLIHRDVKPSNIIFVNGVPKLADIGLVTEFAEAQSFVGTEGFIPPEGPNSPQADLYALGKVLYESSMGKDRQSFPEPISGLGVDADSIALMEFNAVLLRACAPKPQERYRSAEEMNADLALLHSGKSVKDRHTLEHRLKVAKRAVVAILAVLALAVVPYYVAIKEARRFQAEARKSQEAMRFLAAMLEGVGPSKAKGRDTTMLREVLDETAKSVARDLKNQPEVQADLYLVMGKTYDALGQFTNALALTKEALRLREICFGPENQLVADALANTGAMYYDLGDLSNAVAIGSEALAMRRRLLGNEHTNVATSLNNVGLALWNEGKFVEAKTMQREALAIRKKVLGPEHRDVAISLNNLAIVELLLGDSASAEAHFSDVLIILKKLNADKGPFAATLQNNLANLLLRKGDYAAAETMHQETLELRRRLLGTDHADIAYSLTQLAVAETALGELDKAEARLQEAWSMEGKLSLQEHPNAADTVADLGSVLMKKGDFSGAEAKHQQALAMRKKLGEQNADLDDSLDALALLAAVRGDLSQAEALLQQAIKIDRQTQGEQHQVVIPRLLHLAWVFQSKGDIAGAESSMREAVAIGVRQGVYGAQALTEGTYDLADILQAQGKFQEAEPLMLRSVEYPQKCAAPSTPLQRHALERVVRFYEAWGTLVPDAAKSASAAEWQRRLADFDKAKLSARPR